MYIHKINKRWNGNKTSSLHDLGKRLTLLYLRIYFIRLAAFVSLEGIREGKRCKTFWLYNLSKMSSIAIVSPTKVKVAWVGLKCIRYKKRTLAKSYIIMTFACCST
jgi:hypothetical protein